ncbi:MAG: Brp/Blh family beta-carotene 15,15'-dioxygenase [Aquabacterium sp.]|nr:Brp/Blh family beta-carotene 15,15'-dioxygenase [Ferruginibacter sp.]
MIRIVLLLLGGTILFFQQYIIPLNSNIQFILFLAGVILLGVPHGAADLLVASRTADAGNKVFSKFRFLIVYVSRLLMFTLILWLFPVTGNLLFIFFAAYHFGETDLNQFKTNTLTGKLFVISYGLVILSVILLHHFEEVKPVYQLFESGKRNEALINWIDLNRYYISSATGALFFICSFLYFLNNDNTGINEAGEFLVRFAVILLILFNLPLLLGFTFYFVIWHSVLSLNNIVLYLRNNNTFSRSTIARQILLYSALAISGIGLFGLAGFMFVNIKGIEANIFLGLAVLTAPHMQIMHDMYNNLRLNRLV